MKTLLKIIVAGQRIRCMYSICDFHYSNPLLEMYICIQMISMNFKIKILGNGISFDSIKGEKKITISNAQ